MRLWRSLNRELLKTTLNKQGDSSPESVSTKILIQYTADSITTSSTCLSWYWQAASINGCLHFVACFSKIPYGIWTINDGSCLEELSQFKLQAVSKLIKG